MSKKRKALASLGDNNSSAAAPIDITASAENLAAGLLSILPRCATLQHNDAKKLLRALELVKGQLKKRSDEMAAITETQGAAQRILFLDDSIAVPDDVFHRVLEFIPFYDRVQIVSLVSKTWLSASRMPQLWQTLDKWWTLNLTRKFTMTDFIQLLGRPQFASLKSLGIPSKIKLGKSGMQKLAAVYPHLENLDAGFVFRSVYPTDADLVAASTLFPHLTKIGFNLYHATCGGALTVARNLGERVLDLRIEGETVTHRSSYLSDTDLEIITRACPNLTVFMYGLDPMFYDPEKDKFTGRGIQALMNCSNLEMLVLTGTQNIDLAAFKLLGTHTKLWSLLLHYIPILFDSNDGIGVRLGLEMAIDDFEVC